MKTKVYVCKFDDEERQKRIEQLEKENLALEELNDLSEMRKRVMDEIGLKERLNIEDDE